VERRRALQELLIRKRCPVCAEIRLNQASCLLDPLGPAASLRSCRFVADRAFRQLLCRFAAPGLGQIFFYAARGETRPLPPYSFGPSLSSSSSRQPPSTHFAASGRSPFSSRHGCKIQRKFSWRM